MKNYFNFKPYHQTFTNELSLVDMNRCHHECHALLNTFLNATSHLKVLCTDQSTYDRNAVLGYGESTFAGGFGTLTTPCDDVGWYDCNSFDSPVFLQWTC
jgi:hypothetical protein